ncbi:MAG: hypothetical protein EZS28_005317 [Streblomastix strix]|uniref:Uncharacterized protein n=1 Tax=Streblomastix strix TaxID=222440 RepID=A0A5J4WVX2_9EUKA|nr:MAG: hypothetical protein EZS28_005317 [Streblomastix strix]
MKKVVQNAILIIIITVIITVIIVLKGAIIITVRSQKQLSGKWELWIQAVRRANAIDSINVPRQRLGLTIARSSGANFETLTLDQSTEDWLSSSLMVLFSYSPSLDIPLQLLPSSSIKSSQFGFDPLTPYQINLCSAEDAISHIVGKYGIRNLGSFFARTLLRGIGR